MKFTEEDIPLMKLIFNPSTHEMGMMLGRDRAKEILKFCYKKVGNIDFKRRREVFCFRLLGTPSLTNFLLDNDIINLGHFHGESIFFLLKDEKSENPLFDIKNVISHIHKIDDGEDLYSLLRTYKMNKELWDSGRLNKQFLNKNNIDYFDLRFDNRESILFREEDIDPLKLLLNPKTKDVAYSKYGKLAERLMYLLLIYTLMTPEDIEKKLGVFQVQVIRTPEINDFFIDNNLIDYTTLGEHDIYRILCSDKGEKIWDLGYLDAHIHKLKTPPLNEGYFSLKIVQSGKIDNLLKKMEAKQIEETLDYSRIAEELWFSGKIDFSKLPKKTYHRFKKRFEQK